MLVIALGPTTTSGFSLVTCRVEPTCFTGLAGTCNSNLEGLKMPVAGTHSVVGVHL